MGESERNLIEAKVKRLIDKIRDQQNIFDKRECTYKEEVTKLKTQLEEGNKIISNPISKTMIYTKEMIKYCMNKNQKD